VAFAVMGGGKGQSKHFNAKSSLLSHMCKTFGISLEKLYFKSEL
jgi:hypothetical protein